MDAGIASKFREAARPARAVLFAKMPARIAAILVSSQFEVGCDVAMNHLGTTKVELRHIPGEEGNFFN